VCFATWPFRLGTTSRVAALHLVSLRLTLTESALSYADKPLTCRDCGQAFVFTTGEQEFFAQKGFANEPTRCPDCRAARKASSGGGGYSSGGYGSGGYSSGGGYGRQDREMFSAVCSSCGNEARVPFQPRGDKPVYCTECFSKTRGSSGGGGYSGRRDSY
jgi:CxxC-x17-CxxC domain-containing protein